MHEAENGNRTGRRLELDSLLVEYGNLFERSNKLDNKVYISITFCGFLFVFITGLFSGISQLGAARSIPGRLLEAAYVVACIGVMVSYAFVLVYFMRLLEPEGIIRMDPERIREQKLEACGSEEACEKLILLYREVINADLDKLARRCHEFTGGLRYIMGNVILAFAAYVLQVALQALG